MALYLLSCVITIWAPDLKGYIFGTFFEEKNQGETLSEIKPHFKASTIDKLKTTDVLGHFKKPQLLKQLSGFNLIQSKKLSIDGYKLRNSYNFYLDADGNTIEIVNDKELAKLIVNKKQYHLKDDPKKRMIVTSIKSKVPELHKGCSKHIETIAKPQ